MANQVFANGMEIACKAAAGKVIAAFPDVCMTPPENPATPPGVPVPYPNTAMASDTTGGSKNVKISDKEIMLKNKSCFKTSTGDEAGCAAKKGVISSKNKGKVYFIKWSMNVKIEGENVDRHLDMTTNNHGSPQANEAVPWPYADTAAISKIDECKDEAEKAGKKCAGKKGPPDCTKECKKAQKCILIPKRDDKKACCKEDTTGHHLIEDHWVKFNDDFPEYRSNRGTIDNPPDKLINDGKSVNDAPCVCANSERSKGKHGVLHDVQGAFEESYIDGGGREGQDWNYGAGKEAALWAHQEAFPDSGCTDECLGAQLNGFYGEDNSKKLNKPKKQGLGEDREDLEYIWSDVFADP